MAKLIIKSLDSFGEKSSRKLIAKKIVEGDKKIFFYENSEEKGEMILSPTSTKITRKGEVESILNLTPDNETDFFYSTPYFNKIFTVVCKKYIYSENMLTISYEIYDNDCCINKLEIEIVEVR